MTERKKPTRKRATRKPKGVQKLVPGEADPAKLDYEKIERAAEEAEAELAQSASDRARESRSMFVVRGLFRELLMHDKTGRMWAALARAIVTLHTGAEPTRNKAYRRADAVACMLCETLAHPELWINYCETRTEELRTW